MGERERQIKRNTHAKLERQTERARERQTEIKRYTDRDNEGSEVKHSKGPHKPCKHQI